MIGFDNANTDKGPIGSFSTVSDGKIIDCPGDSLKVSRLDSNDFYQERDIVYIFILERCHSSVEQHKDVRDGWLEGSSGIYRIRLIQVHLYGL